MQKKLQFYIDGRWVDPVEGRTCNVINPATEEVIAQVALGSAKDVDLAAKAARRAFETFSQTTREERCRHRVLVSYSRYSWQRSNYRH